MQISFINAVLLIIINECDMIVFIYYGMM